MKKIVVLFSILISISTMQLHAQYKLNMQLYSPSDYTYHYSDQYNPGICGLASLAFPGLGQIIAGESARGFTIMGSSLGASILSFAGIMMMENSRSVYSSKYSTGAYLFLGGVAATLAIDIFAVYDAVRVAKVNNLYIRDDRKKTMKLQPYISQHISGKTAPGITFTMVF